MTRLKDEAWECRENWRKKVKMCTLGKGKCNSIETCFDDDYQDDDDDNNNNNNNLFFNKKQLRPCCLIYHSPNNKIQN